MIHEQRVKLLNLIEKKKLKLPWYFNEFIDHLDSENCSPNTLLDYCYDIEHFIDWLIVEGFYSGNPIDLPIEILEKLKVKDITTYQNHCKNRLGNKPNTIARKLASLKSWLHYLSQIAEDENLYPYLKRNVMAKIKITKDKVSAKKQAEKISNSILLGDEFHHFRTFLANDYGELIKKERRKYSGYINNRERDLAFASLILGSGLRASEALSINLSDFDWTKNRVEVMRKGGIEDVVSFSDLAAADLREYLKIRSVRYKPDSSEDAFFLSMATRTGKASRLQLRSLQKRFEKYFELYEKNTLTIHKLRHSFATKHFQENNNIPMLQEILNHSDINTTMIYTHVLDEDRHNSVNKTDN